MAQTSGLTPIQLIQKYYLPETDCYRILLDHSERVTQKALYLAGKVRHLNPDYEFIREAAMLHDIGVILTYSPEIECFGKHPYIMHGCLGRELLEKEGYPAHALVCERHIGVGITRADIARFQLPLPDREMTPKTLEEKIICFADTFFSKKPGVPQTEKTAEEIKESISKYGEDKFAVLQNWMTFFGLNDNND